MLASFIVYKIFFAYLKRNNLLHKMDQCECGLKDFAVSVPCHYKKLEP